MTVKSMAEKPINPNPEKQGKPRDEGNPQTPEVPEEGPEGAQPLNVAPTGEGLPPKPVDYKKKFSDSSTENQRILRDNAQLLKEKAELEVQLTESQQNLSGKELKEKYPYWDDMTEEEKREAKEKLADKKRLAILEAKEKWRDDYASLLEETKERIRKKSGEQAFKDFACSPENRGQKNLANLAKQFLYEEPTLESPKEPENKPGLETATGGPKTTAIPKKGFTPEEARELRKRDPQKYNKLVSEGRMKIIDKK